MLIGLVGAGGFIGSCLLRRLTVGSPNTVRVLLRKGRASQECGQVDIVRGDLLSFADCRHFVDGLDVIYYLAHHNTPVSSDHDQVNDARLNVIPLLTLLEAIHERKTKPHLVYFSSGGAVYGRKDERIPFRETDLCAPSSSYGIQKLTAEHYLRLAAERGTLTCTALRVGNAYGALLPRERMQGLIGVAINSVLHNAPIRTFGHTGNIRDYVHLDDICTIATKAAERTHPFTIVNVGSGLGHSVREVLEMIEQHAGLPVEIDSVATPYGNSLADWVVLDIDKARERYRWIPSVDLAAGIRRMFESSRPASA